MSRHNSQQNNNNNNHGSGHLWNSLTPPLTIPTNNIQHEQQLPQVIDVNNDNTDDIDMNPSPSTSVASWQSCTSTETRSSQEKCADELYDQIEDLICEYMRECQRHYLHCRVLRWHLEDDTSKQFSAVIIINPPATKN
ncbi:unnamed protein product [Adineta steineri]|uniref:Uncharacterized protein n=1 Tax=Adineta steineri TaxID=433720 RepID=A0A819FBR6_9BILA|nr:unnamed protein product [Adineta steineri]CAF3865353.1 unnamed protein product [Adineta steineri]